LPKNIVWHEGHSAAGWVCQAGHCGSKIHTFGQWVTDNSAALPTANAGQCATSYCKHILILNFPYTILGVSWKHFYLHSTEDDSLAH